MSDLSVFRGPDFRPEQSPGGIGRPKAKGSRRFRVKASPEQWKQLRLEKLGPCLVCTYLGVEQRYDSTLHHVVPRSQAGDDVPSNLVPVCGDGTRGHHGLIEAHDPETCQLFAAAVQKFDDAVYAYAVDRLGEDGFLARYKVRFGHRAAGSADA